MTLSEYRKTNSWQGALALGPQLVRLAEELPASEEMGLSFQLRQAMVELPAAIAVDLLDGSRTRMSVMMRLVATLDMIEKVFPALDTASSRSAADELAERLAGDHFADQTSGGAMDAAAASPLSAPLTPAAAGGPLIINPTPLAVSAEPLPGAPVDASAVTAAAPDLTSAVVAPGDATATAAPTMINPEPIGPPENMAVPTTPVVPIGLNIVPEDPHVQPSSGQQAS